MSSRRTRLLLLVAPLVVLAVGLLFASNPVPTPAQSEGQLRGRIDDARGRESRLEGQVARLGDLVRKSERELRLLDGKLADAENELAIAAERQARLATRLDAARKRLARLRKKLAADRATLASQLTAGYKADQPDLVTVALKADGFQDLLDHVEFLDRVKDQNTSVVDRVKRARADADREKRRLVPLERRARQVEQAMLQRRNALQALRQIRAQRADQLRRARAARQQALSGTRASRRRAEKELNSLLAARAKAARTFTAQASGAPRPVAAAAGAGAASIGQKGNWAIPWAIVQCESGGQNMTPNSAGASGYYQFIPSTWQGLGGSTKHAYQASKAEQDRLARRLWAGGRGASNWDCAAIVGIT